MVIPHYTFFSPFSNIKIWTPKIKPNCVKTRLNPSREDFCHPMIKQHQRTNYVQASTNYVMAAISFVIDWKNKGTKLDITSWVWSMVVGGWGGCTRPKNTRHILFLSGQIRVFVHRVLLWFVCFFNGYPTSVILKKKKSNKTRMIDDLSWHFAGNWLS